MRRLSVFLLALLLPFSQVLAQETAGAEEDGEETPQDAGPAQPPKPVPFYLPRGAFAGAYLQEGAITPQLRVQWQATLIQLRNDAFVAYLEGGGGFGLSLPTNLQRDFGLPGGMSSLYQHLALIGLGYDAVYQKAGWGWGFQVLTGAKWYGATYTDLVPEAALGGTVEGRLNVGIDVGPLRLMASGGWAQLWVVPRRSVAAKFVGGPIFGIYVNWRPVEKSK